MTDTVKRGQTHRCVGVDYGTKRVGIAVSDPLWMFAQPHGTFSPPDALNELRTIEAQDGVAVAVVGWPLLPDGSEGRATEIVSSFIRRLKKAIPTIAIVKWDERYTSEVARDRIREAGPRSRWKGTKGRLDAAAAAIILQEYLDERAVRHGTPDLPEDPRR
ncbi:MAG: Holliday junction resolvase RuvX [Rhodothermia bacterium]|nr:Holliday junction resolvase RuvX [Rhodothermia bacterium]